LPIELRHFLYFIFLTQPLFYLFAQAKTNKNAQAKTHTFKQPIL
jgi:hypothetical protein